MSRKKFVDNHILHELTSEFVKSIGLLNSFEALVVLLRESPKIGVRETRVHRIHEL